VFPPLSVLLNAIEETFPLPGRFRSKLPGDIAELSRLLTTARGERDAAYLNRPNLLSAYLRYFLPWNVFRLCRIFSLSAGTSAGSSASLAEGQAETPQQGIMPELSDGDVITDLGSGPLTLPIALWLAFPQLRRIKLEFRCVDKSAAVLDAGHKLFKQICSGEVSGTGENSVWQIKTIHASLEEPVRGKPAKLVAAVNVFNEVSSGLYQSGGMERAAKKAATLLGKLCEPDGSILVVEPGNPQGGAFITSLRAAFLEKGRPPAAPCPHAEDCPFPGTSLPGRRNSNTKAKWCHFAFNTEAAPAALHKLSSAAGIPKERATLSFLLTAPQADALRVDVPFVPPANLLKVRITSDAFPVLQAQQKTGAVFGRYACSERGMVLLTGKRPRVEALGAGMLLELPLPVKEQRDAKTGALVVAV